MLFCYTHRPMSHSAITREPSCGRWELTQRPTAGQCRQWEIMEHSVQNGMLSSNPSLQSSGDPIEVVVQKDQSRWKTPGEQGSLNQSNKAHMNSQRVMQKAWDLQGSVSGPLRIYCSFQLSIFMEFLSVWTSGTLILVPALRDLLLLLGCLVQPWCDGFCFCFFIVFYFVIFGCYLLEACFFLNER